MQVSQIPYKFGTPWAADAATGYLTASIPATSTTAAASQELGFPPITATPIGSGGIPPNIADFNGLGYYVTLWTQWLQAGGSIGYDSTFATAIGGYPKGAILASATSVGNSWLCTTDNNTANPDTGGAGWQLIGRPFASLPDAVSANTTWTIANNGSFVLVSSLSTQTLPAPSSVPGMTIGFVTAMTAQAVVTAPSGLIFGGGINSASVTVGAGGFIALQSNGSNWLILSASPDVLGYLPLTGGTLTGDLAAPAYYVGSIGSAFSLALSSSNPTLAFLANNYIQAASDGSSMTVSTAGTLVLSGTSVTAPSPLSSDASTKVATTAYVEAQFSGGSNGNGVYHVIGVVTGGAALQICRFTVGNVAAGGSFTWTFPLAFAAPPQVFVSIVQSGGSTPDTPWFSAAPTTTSVTVNNPNTYAVNIDLLAVL